MQDDILTDFAMKIIGVVDYDLYKEIQRGEVDMTLVEDVIDLLEDLLELKE